MAVTRSFGRPVTSLDELREAVAAYATRAGEKLRAHGLVAGQLAAFFHTSRFREDGPQHHGQRSTRLVPTMADTGQLITAALRCVEAAWRGERGCRYEGRRAARRPLPAGGRAPCPLRGSPPAASR